MDLELDHLLIVCSANALEADRLLRAGFLEREANVHPGQGPPAEGSFGGSHAAVQLSCAAERAHRTWSITIGSCVRVRLSVALGAYALCGD
jgi:hypothetical protein